ncbi:PEP-CTERM motif protein [Stieleria maiorica]|uniref:PEP-CTERM motif protein n=1 Tax=Stieleria maiorica TaxID=2795974 RepID=A0A5B9MJ41_9BACT|nr:PEP-CTERM sorting domain-containing protein [Stieleria maiorica]QEF99664.1 PEP-CTERM motif protein [Stieleria maiorica]
MKISRFVAFAVCAAMAMCCNSLQAAYITSNGTVQMEGPFGAGGNTGGNPPLDHITEFGTAAGQLWTNQIGGAAFAPGSTVRTVGSLPLSQLINGSVIPVDFPDGLVFSDAHFIFAIEGTILPGGAFASFSTGSLFLVPSRNGQPVGVTFDQADPLTYNFDDVVAKWDLAPTMGIIDGNTVGISVAGPVSATAGEVNVSGLTGPGNSGAGVFVFLEDEAFVPTGVDPGIAPFDGPDFVRNVEAIVGQPNAAEGIAAFTDQTQDTTVTPLTPAQIAVLNTIGAAAGFSGLWDGSGEGDTYSPVGFGQPGQTGDFSADLSSENYVIAAPVPEPTSMAIFAVGFAVACGRRRKRS